MPLAAKRPGDDFFVFPPDEFPVDGACMDEDRLGIPPAPI
jgi:hypothetical protein